MTAIKLAKVEEPCIVYPWVPCDQNKETKIKPITHDNYLDHISNLKIKSSQTRVPLTTIACSVRHNVTRGLIEELCEKGLSMVVFDFIGLTHEQCRNLIFEIRQGICNYSVGKNSGVPYSLALVLDLGGTRILTGTVMNTKPDHFLLELTSNGHIFVTNNIEYKYKCTEDRIYVNSDSIFQLKECDQIFLDYGKIELIVERVDPEEVYCLIKRGEYLGSRKVVHIPEIPIGMTTLTENDENDIISGIQLKVDVILVPGVRNAAFFNRVRNFLCQEKGKDIDLYAKIDNSVGFENIDDILPIVDGIFLHRLNLSMELGYDKIFLSQKSILSKCNIAGKPTMTFGGFLNSMEFNTVPSSSEIHDIITTVLDGTDCIYLDVTIRSPYKVQCIKHALSVCRQGEIAQWDQELSDLKSKSKPKVDAAYAISIGCVNMSMKCYASAIIIITTSGLSAKVVARYRPRCPILAIVRQEKPSRKISVWRNLLSVYYVDPTDPTVWHKDVENRTRFALNYAKKKGILDQGDLVVHMCGSNLNTGFTNNMSLFYVCADDILNF